MKKQLLILISIIFLSCQSDDDIIIEEPQINVEILSFESGWIVNPDIPFWYHYTMTATIHNKSDMDVHGYIHAKNANNELVVFGEYYNPLYNPLILQPNEIKVVVDTSNVYLNHSQIVSKEFVKY